jgi:protein gp37
MAKRLKGMGSEKYQKDGDPKTSGPGFGLTLHEAVLTLPLKWRKPRRVFVNSMSDLFHKDVPDEFIARLWAVMAATPQHTYQILTKRHGRMRSMLRRALWFQQLVIQEGAWIPTNPDLPVLRSWPLSNVHLGVSVEDQKRANLRIPALLDTPAAVRFLSCEPLISPVDLSVVYVRNGTLPVAPLEIHYDQDTAVGLHPISWVIVGGESGPGARPCDPEWIRSLVKQCETADVPVFVKQLGSGWAHANGCDGKGGEPQQWPADLRVRQFPISGVPV